MWPLYLFWIPVAIVLVTAAAGGVAWWFDRSLKREAAAEFSEWLQCEAPTLPIPVVKR